MHEFFYKLIEDGTYAITGYRGDEEEVTIPDICGKTTVISDDIFKGHKELQKVHFPAGVTNIGGFFLDGCENVKEISLPPNLENLWQYAFVRSSLEQIDIPGTVKEIIPFVFKDCKQLREVTIHPGTREICAYAFQGCTSLEKIILPTDTVISPNAFDGCNLNFEIVRTKYGSSIHDGTTKISAKSKKMHFNSNMIYRGTCP